MNGILKRGLITLAVTGGLLALGAGVAYADDTDGDGGLLSGTQAILGGTLPVTVSGNGISVIGNSSSNGGSASTPSSGGSSSGSTSGNNSLLGGTQGKLGLFTPVAVSGNAISVLGDSSSDGSTFSGTSGSSDSGSASTSGEDGVVGGTQILGDVGAPVTVGGNAVSVVGDSSSSGSATSPGSGGSSPAITTGGDGVLGGTQVVTAADAPVTVGGNAISVVGDSTVDNPGTGGEVGGEVGGETTTPPTTGGVTAAAVGGVSLLAATGSSLQGWMLAFATLMLAAGITFSARTRAARS